MNKSEIATKIKSAIEEKLCTLGAYVDKELPEYILVMIANKKNKESMGQDLQLFLGQETTSFIEWLHDLLEKCQTNPEDAFRIKAEKPPKVKSNNSPDKKKKVDKEKQKIKSKSRKSDDKKEHRKGNLNKPSRNRSRSRSPKSEVTQRSSNETKSSKSKLTPDKKIETTKQINKQSDTGRKKEDTHINDKIETIEPQKTVPSVVSTVKVTERPAPKKELLKSSMEMVQRDLKEAEADITSKTETTADKPSQRSSVFTRLGTNDLRTKITKPQDESQEKVSSSVPLKRTIQTAQSGGDNDTRESKVKRLENDAPSPYFIVTLKGADKLNIPLTSRLGPKRTQEQVDCAEGYESSDVEVEAGSLEDTEELAPVDTTTGTQSTRCRFWPWCKNKDTCPFIHPTQPCQLFPACKFGAQCLFIHPNCRFSANCTKPDCPYTHYGPRPAMTGSVGMKPVTAPLIGGPASIQSRCLYFPNCTNVNCKFFHPNLPCRFGMSCKQKDSCLFYHPSIPNITELKWIANHETTRPSMLDSSSNSKKAEIQTA